MDDSEKRENFERLAEKRTQAVLDKLDILANCADTRRYEYDKDDVEAIFTAIRRKLQETESKFDVEQGEFQL